MASAPFPAADNPFETRAPIKIEMRGTVVPSFYLRHERDGAGIVVKKSGVPLLPTFTVDRVPPERRWAIRPDGELLEQAEFESLLERVYIEAGRAYSHDGRQTPKWNPRNCAIPRVERYVSVEINPMKPSEFIPMGYRPRGVPGARQIPERYFDGQGEPVEARPMDVLLDCYYDDRMKKRLLPHEIEAVEKHLHAKRLQRQAAEERAAKPQTPEKAEKPKRKQKYVSRAKGPQSAPCGKLVQRNLPGHLRFCPACQALAASAAQPPLEPAPEPPISPDPKPASPEHPVPLPENPELG